MGIRGVTIVRLWDCSLTQRAEIMYVTMRVESAWTLDVKILCSQCGCVRLRQHLLKGALFHKRGVDDVAQGRR